MAEVRMENHSAPKEEKREKVEKAITGTAKRKKKSELSKVGGAIISEDAKKVKDHILLDVLIPAFKNLLADVVSDAVNMALFGDTKRRDSDYRSGSSRYVSYDSRYRGGYSSRSNQSERSYSTGYSFDDIVLDSRGDAAEVLDRMNEILDTYGLVRVADMYDLVGLRSNYTDNNYGWTSLRTADIRRGRDGYYLQMPKAMPID